MRFGGSLVAIAAVLATTGCGEGKLEIRSIASPLAPGVKAVSFRVAEGWGQFALGNVGLALESFRKAGREEPGNIDALVGVAACYDRMGRFDLSRRNYEAALALAPRDRSVLAALAASLDVQQRAPEAAKVRQEMVDRSAIDPIGQLTTSTAVALSPILPLSVADAVAAALAASKWPQDYPRRVVQPAPTRHAALTVSPDTGPRLERLSMGEIALVTTAGPQWRVQQDQPRPRQIATGAAATRQAAAERSGIRLFNAARVERLASRARTYLSNRGWAIASVGDLALPRARSLILYPANRRAAAARLAAQLGFAMEARADVRQVTVLLGRDAANLPTFKALAG